MPSMAHAFVLSTLADATGRRPREIAFDATLTGDLGLTDRSLEALGLVLGLCSFDDGDQIVSACVDTLCKSTVQDVVALTVEARRKGQA